MKSMPAAGLSRRVFLRRASLLLGGVGLLGPSPAHAARAQVTVQTVLGRIPVERMGFTLVHEHVLCDFVGADKTGRDRWNVDEVARTMEPHLLAAKERGVKTFVDCTPAYIGRDPRVLRRLSAQTGLQILTNTGYYGAAGDKYVPRHAFDETAEQLADRWVRESEAGIEDTGVRPGFIKTGVDEAAGDPPSLSDIDAKLIRAAARASRRTGLAVTCHTGGGPAGLAALDLFAREGGDPGRFIVAHADGHGLATHERIAGKGAWISFDGLGGGPVEEQAKRLMPVVERWPRRVLLSMDAGWYWAGEPGGGKVRGYTSLSDVVLPALERAGVSRRKIRQLTVENPALAFGCAPAETR